MKRTTLLVVLLVLAVLTTIFLFLFTTIESTVSGPGFDETSDSVYRVADVAVPLWILTSGHVAALVLALVAAWRLLRGRKGRGVVFAVTGGGAILASALLCTYSLDILGMFCVVLVGAGVGPIALGFGLAWVFGLAGGARRKLALSVLVIALSAAPLSMLAYPWPLHGAFWVSKSSLDRLATDVLAGNAVEFPQRAGLFRIVDAVTEGENVALITDPKPSGRSGLVRVVPDPDGKVRGPLHNLNWNVQLARNWRYQNED